MFRTVISLVDLDTGLVLYIRLADCQLQVAEGYAYSLVSHRSIGCNGGLEAALLLVGNGGNVVKSTHGGKFDNCG